MPLTINGKVFLNIQEAVAWLLANNALPFQCKTNYVADTEIAKTDIINPSPAEIKIGSLVLFADGKVGTVSGITANGFMVGSESTDLSDGVPHVTGIEINASQHLIFTMSEGDPIDAGLVKEISSFTINASQHLVANYNDGTTQDLGAIFQGNVNIAGNLTADSIIENMTGYAFERVGSGLTNWTPLYVSVCKNGNKLTFVLFGTYQSDSPANQSLGVFYLPHELMGKLVPYQLGSDMYVLDTKEIQFFSGLTTYKKAVIEVEKHPTLDKITLALRPIDLVASTLYYFRAEITFLLSDNLA